LKFAGLDGFADARRKWNDQSGSMRQRLDSEFISRRAWCVKCVGELRGARWDFFELGRNIVVLAAVAAVPRCNDDPAKRQPKKPRTRLEICP
jgi:hypothetical protein